MSKKVLTDFDFDTTGRILNLPDPIFPGEPAPVSYVQTYVAANSGAGYGRKIILSGENVQIPSNQQMIIKGKMKIQGHLKISGELSLI